MRPALLLTALVIGCISLLSGSPAGAAEIRVLIWSEYIDPELVEEFEQKSGHKVVNDVYEETEAMIAKLQATGGKSGYDLIVASDHAVPVLAQLKLIRKLDAAKIPNSKNVSPQFQNPAYDPEGTYIRPYQWGTVGIFYNRKKLATPPVSWNVILSPGEKSPTFVLIDNMRDMLGVALKAQGRSVNEADKSRLQEAARSVLSAKKHAKCLGFEGSVAGCKKVIAGEADMAIVYNGDALNAIAEAPEESQDHFDYVVPGEGSIIWTDTMMVASGSMNADAAHALIDFLLDGENGARLSNYINYATPNAASLPHINAESLADPRIYPPAEQVKTLEYLRDMGKDTSLYDSLWTTIKSR